ncbi:hypothetical protein CFR72_10185 [Gluconacetobacter entanii]|uniref:Uncharacterized protein n=1 Tax=Gluconacetobacter entanii TaxID=108528 RepID=A0A318PQM1_9PROT|nr:hypothetical protein CFR72_10185 [Gluconacetobacter entanii]
MRNIVETSRQAIPVFVGSARIVILMDNSPDMRISGASVLLWFGQEAAMGRHSCFRERIFV